MSRLEHMVYLHMFQIFWVLFCFSVPILFSLQATYQIHKEFPRSSPATCRRCIQSPWWEAFPRSIPVQLTQYKIHNLNDIYCTIQYNTDLVPVFTALLLQLGAAGRVEFRRGGRTVRACCTLKRGS